MAARSPGRGRGITVQQFFAILKDSFREAVDGFVIYAMLAMAAIVIVLIGSISYTPAEPKPAFSRLAGNTDWSIASPASWAHSNSKCRLHT